ncbi:uncharacterized protein BKA55DRAFT_565116 [Fusarium redolens]|uniref:Uncharacterized protein n=1 Tax=Fusarium redolens TaxID=48865 RepID=A0A9P9KAY6_FUSRE|nr:uncharacterized protein BKA55DRAFT_565116 [Fusarium redolens]KAH7255807.1 hypothetical protein BKA55DRAFT_565116 [Fusarium redolens]
MTVGATDRSPEHRGVCVPNPPGTESNIALHYVTTARQTNWPPGLVKPCFDFKIDTVLPVGSLRSSLNSLFDPGYYDKQRKEYVCRKIAITGYKGVEINMYNMPDASTVMIECDTVILMNSGAYAFNLTLAARFWNYSHNFQKEPVKVNFHEKFPGLARAYKEDKFDGEVARLVETLQDVPAGHAFCTGGPGSGKTTTVLKIVEAVLSGLVETIDVSDPDAKKWKTSQAPGDNTSQTPAVDAWGAAPAPAGDESHTSEPAADEKVNAPAIPQYEVIPTESGDLECGLFAIINSLFYQLTEHAPESVDQLRSILRGPEMTKRMAQYGGLGTSNLTVDQVAAVLQRWGDERDINLQLDVIVDGDQPSAQVLFPSEDRTTI